MKEIEDLIDVLIEREITEFEMEKAGLRIRIKRGESHSANPGHVSSTPAFSPASTVNSPIVSAPVAPPAEETPEAPEDLYVIKSPIVGTFFGSPSPNAPPFVNLGDKVEVGQVLCIIEAMKLMNEIESEVAGEIVRVYVENGQPVEYGQSLFAIRPSHKK